MMQSPTITRLGWTTLMICLSALMFDVGRDAGRTQPTPESCSALTSNA